MQEAGDCPKLETPRTHFQAVGGGVTRKAEGKLRQNKGQHGLICWVKVETGDVTCQAFTYAYEIVHREQQGFDVQVGG